MILISYEGDVVGGDAVEVEVERGVFNPCNNPADAWQIIESNGIGMRKQSNGLWCATRMGGAYPIYDDKPLRAAMIVFLMMQEAK
ncbi:TPA: DUF2591 family protein [Klebsiella aerogenes]|nr:DUF2591 family protein [Klebsiella aerogenes]